MYICFHVHAQMKILAVSSVYRMGNYCRVHPNHDSSVIYIIGYHVPVALESAACKPPLK